MPNEDDERAKTLLSYAQLMEMLLESKRFIDFFELNFDLLKITDPDTGEVSWVAVEKHPDAVKHLLEDKMEQAMEKAQGGIQVAPANALDELKKG